MTTLILTGIGAGLGALIGAAISSTEKGKKINDKLEDDYDKYGKDLFGQFVALSDISLFEDDSFIG